MAELEWEGHPDRPSLRRAIRHRLRRLDPGIRVIAEGFLAEASAIDLLAVGGEGEIISIRIGRDGEDGALLTQSLADLSWLRPRITDFLKLAPSLGLEPSAEPRAMLFCPEFQRETRAAVENFPARSIELATYHCLRQQGQLSVLLATESPARPQTGEPTRTEMNPPGPIAQREAPRVDLPSPARFRTGLSDADLVLEVDEQKPLPRASD